MAKLTDKFFNRVIEGQLELDASEQAEQDASAVKAVEGASAGTIDKALGLSSQGKLVKSDFPSELPAVAGNAGKVLKVNSGATGVEWGSVSVGTQLYKHVINIINYRQYYVVNPPRNDLHLEIISTRESAYNYQELYNALVQNNYVSCPLIRFTDVEYADQHGNCYIFLVANERLRGYSFRETGFYELPLMEDGECEMDSFNDTVTPL